MPVRPSVVCIALLALGVAFMLSAGVLSARAGADADAPHLLQVATPAPRSGGIATAEQLQAAQAVWSASRHASTYDNGAGANTTCASCKSPRNWDPSQLAAADAAHDCASCKREPGQPRPTLPGGVLIAQAEWKNIGCDVCHQPAGDSYSTAVSFWNQQKGAYEPVSGTTELCGKCHEGSHGFEVIYEQSHSTAHKGWDCTRCHGAHNTPVKCTDCHDVTAGKSAQIHAAHPQVNCTACHDAGGLPIWQDPLPDSRHFGEYIPERFAHTLRSWPSHNLQTPVDCRRCHHPQGDVLPVLPNGGEQRKPVTGRPAIAPNIACSTPGCHPSGAAFQWCPAIPRTGAPAAPAAGAQAQGGAPAVPPANASTAQASSLTVARVPTASPTPRPPAQPAVGAAAAAGPAAAASEPQPTPAVQLVMPGEGETYYTTGWNSHVTKVPIAGSVSSGDFDPTQIELRVEVLVGGKLSSSTTAAPDSSGSFETMATVNDFGDTKLASAETYCFWCHGSSDLVLPPGASVIRVIAVEPTGRTAAAERHVFLDRSAQAAIPVEIEVEDRPRTAVRGLVISATTTLYDWRAREFSAISDGDGRASLQVEALTQYPTRYRLSVAPTTIDGVLYSSPEPAEVDVPAGAAAAAPVRLRVRAQAGRIEGALAGAGKAKASPLSVRAVALLSGQSFQAPVQDGRYMLGGLPAVRYVLSADPEQAAALGFQAVPKAVDLGQGQNSVTAGAALTLLPGPVVRGTLRDASTLAPLPFGWIEASAKAPAGGPPTTVGVTPGSGAFAFYGVPRGTRTLIAGAPGYYSRRIPARPGRPLEVALVPVPDTQTRSWGSGALVVPADSLTAFDGSRVTLKFGWLWGTIDAPLTIVTLDANISIRNSAFALEYIPGEGAWLYVMSGTAIINAGGTDVPVGEQQMVAFGSSIPAPQAVALDPSTLQILRAAAPSSGLFREREGVAAQAQNFLAWLGILDLDVVTAVAILGLAVVAGAIGVVLRRRVSGR